MNSFNKAIIAVAVASSFSAWGWDSVEEPDSNKTPARLLYDLYYKADYQLQAYDVTNKIPVHDASLVLNGGIEENPGRDFPNTYTLNINGGPSVDIQLDPFYGNLYKFNEIEVFGNEEYGDSVLLLDDGYSGAGRTKVKYCQMAKGCSSEWEYSTIQMTPAHVKTHFDVKVDTAYGEYIFPVVHENSVVIQMETPYGSQTIDFDFTFAQDVGILAAKGKLQATKKVDDGNGGFTHLKLGDYGFRTDPDLTRPSVRFDELDG